MSRYSANSNDSIYDVIIIGGGMAGLSAAIWLSRYRRRVLVISSGPPRNYLSHALHGFPGYEGEDPNVLLEKVKDEALAYGVSIVDAWANEVAKEGRKFKVIASGVTYRSKRLLLATGTVDEKPDIPDLEKYEGRSIWHCPACDGYEYTDKKITIVGWGPHIAGYTREFLTYTNDITLLTNGHKSEAGQDEIERLQNDGIKVLKSRIESLEGSGGQVKSVTLEDGSVVTCDGVFYSIKHSPRLELLQQLGCGLRQDNCAKVNRKQETTIKGVYVAGDIAPLEELAVVAAAMGTVAANNIHKSLQ